MMKRENKTKKDICVEFVGDQCVVIEISNNLKKMLNIFIDL